eukprot:TRINITY_DN17010_c0_g1_i1.p1 TRINITY_DN17010_c0_g1~~TRINITY_DN17010_c0_g1_i1.p1  ORF type:complete len:737 (-),score=86.50 TRINITY_DN17010_c0_g1_i1:468-2348(-)
MSDDLVCGGGSSSSSDPYRRPEHDRRPEHVTRLPPILQESQEEVMTPEPEPEACVDDVDVPEAPMQGFVVGGAVGTTLSFSTTSSASSGMPVEPTGAARLAIVEMVTETADAAVDAAVGSSSNVSDVVSMEFPTAESYEDSKMLKMSGITQLQVDAYLQRAPAVVQPRDSLSELVLLPKDAYLHCPPAVVQPRDSLSEHVLLPKEVYLQRGHNDSQRRDSSAGVGHVPQDAIIQRRSNICHTIDSGSASALLAQAKLKRRQGICPSSDSVAGLGPVLEEKYLMRRPSVCVTGDSNLGLGPVLEESHLKRRPSICQPSDSVAGLGPVLEESHLKRRPSASGKRRPSIRQPCETVAGLDAVSQAHLQRRPSICQAHDSIGGLGPLMEENPHQRHPRRSIRSAMQGALAKRRQNICLPGDAAPELLAEALQRRQSIVAPEDGDCRDGPLSKELLRQRRQSICVTSDNTVGLEPQEACLQQCQRFSMPNDYHTIGSGAQSEAAFVVDNDDLLSAATGEQCQIQMELEAQLKAMRGIRLVVGELARASRPNRKAASVVAANALAAAESLATGSFHSASTSSSRATHTTRGSVTSPAFTQRPPRATVCGILANVASRTGSPTKPNVSTAQLP